MSSTPTHTHLSILVLGGGPDSEREVSIRSAKTIADGLAKAGFTVHARTIGRLTLDELKQMPGDVVFPILHGGWGEGGQLQELLERDGRPFVGSGSRASRLAMDKIATKFVAQGLNIPTPAVHLLDARDAACPLPFPVVMKPVHDGSTIGLYVCKTQEHWNAARRHIDASRASDGPRSYMIEPCVTLTNGRKARELTVGVLDGVALPIIEITPAVELYDYEAKYNRDDTTYKVAPELPPGVGERIQRQTVELFKAMGLRHLARADFMLDDSQAGDGGGGVAWLLEINSLPGFTDHSLVPMACRHLHMQVPEVVTRLVEMAVRDARVPPDARPVPGAARV